MNGEIVIRILGIAGGWPVTAFDGQYLVDYDPSRDGIEPGTGTPMTAYLKTTPNIAEARRFPSAVEAHALWTAVDTRQPVRGDGRPNRPLTAFTVDMVPVANEKQRP